MSSDQPAAGALPAGPTRVQAGLVALGSAATVRMLADSTRTSVEAAAALGVEVDAIGKTVVLLADGAPVAVVLCGGDRVDTDRLATTLGGATIGRAHADAVRAATGYPIGGVSPIGLPDGVTLLVDDGLERFGEVWVAAGHPRSVFPTTHAFLAGLPGARRVKVGVPPA